MLTAAIIGFCVLLFVLAIVAPRLSRHPERGGQSVLSVGSRGASKAPGRLGHWLAKPFHHSSKAVRKSGSAGRRTRGKLPLQSSIGPSPPPAGPARRRSVPRAEDAVTLRYVDPACTS